MGGETGLYLSVFCPVGVFVLPVADHVTLPSVHGVRSVACANERFWVGDVTAGGAFNGLSYSDCDAGI